MTSKLLVLALIALPGCTAATPAATPPAPAPSVESERGPLDRLTITLELDAASVRSGEVLEGVVVVRNGSARPVVERDCAIAAGRYGLVPEDDPNAELWLQPVVDCAGRFVFEPGAHETYGGLELAARTKYGEPLPPGRYLAALAIEGYSERLEVPVEVTD